MRFERTHFVRQRFRQHRNHAAREVNRIATIARFTIQRIAGFYIVRNIGNRHQQAEPGIFAAALSFRINRIIKIFCGFAVNGDKRQIAQIHPAFDIRRRNFLRYFCLYRQHIRWPFMRQIVLAQCDFDFHARVSIVTNNLQHARDRFGLFGGLGHQLHHHHLACGSAADVSGLHQNILANSLVLSDHKIHAVLNKQATHQLGVATLNHFNNRGFTTAPFINPYLTHHCAITMKHFLHLLGT